MADLSQIPDESRHKLPPISPRTKPSGAGSRPAKKKKKTESEDLVQNRDTNPTPTSKRRRRDLSNGEDSGNEGRDVPVVKTKRKKRIPDENGGLPDSEETPRSEKTSQTRKVPRSKKDVSGSKTSLLSKDEGGDTTDTPRTKVKKKKKKKVQKSADEGDYTDSGLAADLTSIEDDVVQMDETQVQEETTVQHPNSVSVVTLKSQPTNKIFIETDRGFKGQDKMKVARRIAEEKKRPLEMEEPTSSTSIEFALKTHRILKTFFLFCHGVTAGIAMWHIVLVYVLSYHPTDDFLSHYQPLALPVQCMFYILLVCCTISAFDRNDISYPTRMFIRQAFTLQSGAVAIVIYFIALVFSVAIAAQADRINLCYAYPDLWLNEVAEHELSVWRSLNTVRGVLAILGWFVLSLTPNIDRLSENLRTSEDFLGTGVEMLSVSKA